MTHSDIQALVEMHAVYRMYDRAGRLLYVGVTGNLGRRMDSHAEKRWFPLVDSIRLEWFPDRPAAEEAEFIAIRDESPEYNLAGVVLELQRRRAEAKQHRARVDAYLAANSQVKAMMTLRDAVYAGVCGTRSLSAVRRRAQRARLRPVGRDGYAYLYSLADLKGLFHDAQ